MIESALKWAQQGYPVFPLKPRDKILLTAHGFKDATLDAQIIKDLWTHAPHANIGIATGGWYFVLDVDGPDGEQSLAEWESRYGALPPTLEQSTGKGRHLFFQSNAKVKSSAGKGGSRIDVRGAGGYVVAAPSVHPSGRQYEIKRKPLTGAPQWLVDLIVPAERLASRSARSLAPCWGLTRIVGTIAAAREGMRNCIAFWGVCRAGELVAEGVIAESFAEELLVEAARQAGLPDFEAVATIRNGIKTGAERGRDG